MDGIEEAARAGMAASLRAGVGVQPPTVHMLTDDLVGPYAGYVTCRPFHNGDDAAQAITALGELPGALEANRVVVTWEAHYLNAALQEQVDTDGSALVLLDAALSGQVLRRHPLRVRPGRRSRTGALVAEWGASMELRDPQLPEVIVGLLELWRRTRPGDLNGTIDRLKTAGYRIGWAGR